jgi:hypothetical protein
MTKPKYQVGERLCDGAYVVICYKRTDNGRHIYTLQTKFPGMTIALDEEKVDSLMSVRVK